MKYLTLNIDNTKSIEIHNSLLGKETIFYNGEQVSQKKSIFGATHEFEVLENGKEVKYKVEIGLRFSVGVSCNIYRNEDPILLF
jgi:uncharacterized protein YxjI